MLGAVNFRCLLSTQLSSTVFAQDLIPGDVVFYNEKTGLPRPVQATIVAIYTAESGSHLPLRLDTDYPLTLTDRIYRVSRHGITKFKPLSEFELLPGEYKRCVRFAGDHEPYSTKRSFAFDFPPFMLPTARNVIQSI